MVQEFRFAFRSLRRSTLFSSLFLLAFSLGIGAVALVFSVLDAIVLRPPSFVQPESLVVASASENNGGWDDVRLAVFEAIRSRSDTFSEAAAYRTAIFTVTRVQTPDQAFGLTVSPGYFRLLRAYPLLGRLLTAQDDLPSAPRTVLVSYRAWQTVFGSDPKIVGKSAEIDGQLHTVIGVMPADFVPPGPKASLWTPLRLTAAELGATDVRWVHVIARLRPDTSVAKARGTLDAIAKTVANGKPVRLRVTPWHDNGEKNHRVMAWLAMGMVCGLLLIGCANLSSLLLARSTGRRREFAIRLATGANRTRLISESLAELGLLSSGSILLAWFGASAALPIIRHTLAYAPNGLPAIARAQLDARALLITFIVALAAALVCAVYPIWSATSIDLSSGLRDSGTQPSSSRHSRRFFRLLLGIQAGIAMLLLLTSGLLMQSLHRLLLDDHGIRPEHVLTLRLPTGSYQRAPIKRTEQEEARRLQHYLALLKQAEQVNGVRTAAIASSLPLSHAVTTTRLLAPRETAGNMREEIMPVTQSVTRDYFRTMGIPLLTGRGFEPRDAASKAPVALVNQAFVRKYFGGANPIGRSVNNDGGTKGTEIVGVVRDTPFLELSEAVEPEIYFNFEQSSMTSFLTALVIRTAGDPRAIANTLRKSLELSSPNQAVVQVRTLQSLVEENVWQPRFAASLFASFAALALCLSAVGIYGVVTYVTRSRCRDHGIRLALGATRGAIFRLSAVEGLVPVLTGAAVGCVASYWMGKWIASLLYRTGSFDMAALSVSLFMLLALAFAALLRPAIRATQLDPAAILRAQ